MVGPKFPLSLVLTAVDRITGPLDRINSRIVRMNRARTRPLLNPTSSLRNSIATLGATAGVPRIIESFRGVTSAIGDVATAAEKSFKRVSVLAVGAGGLAYLFKRQFIDTAAQFQTMQVSLDAIEGSREKAIKSMDFLKNLALTSPFQITDLMGAFRLMRAQGMDPMNGQLQALIDYVSKLGGSNEMLMSIATQLSQATSKQKLQQQDIRVMAEQGVGVWGLLERAITRVSKGTKKVDSKALMAMSEKGQLGLKAINLLIEQMGIESQGQAQRMSKTWTGMVNRLSTQWSFFRLRVMDSGPFQRVTSYLQGILDRIDVMGKNGQLQRLADRFATKLLDVFTWLEMNGPQILGQIWTNAQRVWSIADKVATAFGGWGNFITFGIAAYIGGPLVASVFSLVASIAALNVALLGTPAGWLLSGAGLALLGGIVAYKSLKWPELPRGPQSTLLPGALDRNGNPLIDAHSMALGMPSTPIGPTMFDIPRGPAVAAAPPPMRGMPSTPIGPTVFDIPRGPAVAAAPPPMPLQLSAEEQAAFRASFAAASAPAPSAPARDARVKVDVDFKNVPQGTTIRTKQSGDLPIDFSRGVAMAHAH
jgi:tape measure domain-containing protein